MDDRSPNAEPRDAAARGGCVDGVIGGIPHGTAGRAVAVRVAPPLQRLALAAALSLSASAMTFAAAPSERLLPPGRPQRLPVPADPSLAPQSLAPSDRQRVARLANREIMQRSPSRHRQPPPTPLAESMTVLRLHRRSEQLTQEAELALRRGAIRSARESIIEALQTSAAAADLRSGRSDASRALEQATTAVREAGDLVGRYGHVGTAELQRMIQSHQTPVLHGCRLDTVTPYAAADVYLDFARESFTRAAAGERGVADTLLWLARTELAHQELHGELTESVALTCLRAAIGVDPQHAMASNELGYRAMRLGLLEEAQWALERSLELQPSEPAMQNLIETHRLAGNQQAAHTLAAMLPSLGGKSLSVGPTILQVDPSQFAAISPPLQPPTGSPAKAPKPPRKLQPSGTAEASGTAEESGGGPEAGGGEGSPASGPAADGSYSVLERVADSMRSLWK